MGHASIGNICDGLINRIYAKGHTSIEDCSAALIRAGETLHASKGSIRTIT